MRDEEDSFHIEVLTRKLARLTAMPNYSLSDTVDHIRQHFSGKTTRIDSMPWPSRNMPRTYRVVDGGLGWPVVEEW